MARILQSKTYCITGGKGGGAVWDACCILLEILPATEYKFSLYLIRNTFAKEFVSGLRIQIQFIYVP